MKSLEKGQDKIQKICDTLRHEVLKPAQVEASRLVEAAKEEAQELIAKAEKEADQLIKQARSQVEKERSVFRSSLQQSSKQVLEFLRQEIEQKFFNEELQNLLEKQSANPKLIADLVSGIVDGIEKEGIKGNIEVVIPQKVSAQEVNALLLTHVAQKLKDHPIEVGNFSGGVQVKLVGKKMTLDLTDQALKELLANFARKDFRQTIFSN